MGDWKKSWQPALLLVLLASASQVSNDLKELQISNFCPVLESLNRLSYTSDQTHQPL